MKSEIKKLCEDIALLIFPVIFIYLITRILHQIHSFHQETIEEHSKKMRKVREANEKYRKFLGAKKESIPRGDREKKLKAIIGVHEKTVAEAKNKIEEKSCIDDDINNPKFGSLATEDPKSVVERVVSKLDVQETASDDNEDGFEKADFSYVDPDSDVQTYLEEGEPSIGGGLGSDGGAETLTRTPDALVSEERELQSEVVNSLSHKRKVQASSSEMVNRNESE